MDYCVIYCVPSDMYKNKMKVKGDCFYGTRSQCYRWRSKKSFQGQYKVIRADRLPFAVNVLYSKK
jgi:hypothetical protein